jgi:hypothetical protein
MSRGPYVALAVLATLLGSCLCAQERTTTPARVSADVYGGYSFVSPNFGTDFFGGPGAHGGIGGADLHLTHSLAVAAETDWMHVVYGTQENSTSFTVMAGPRMFFPLGSHARIKPLADVLVGAASIHSLIGFGNPFTGTSALAIAADGGAEVRAVGPLALRIEGGYLHSGFTARYPNLTPQSSVHNQHGRFLVEGVWHF